MNYFAYLTNNFDFKEFKIYEKIITFNQAKKLAKTIKQEINLLM